MIDPAYKSTTVCIPDFKVDYVPQQLLFKPPVIQPVKKIVPTDQSIVNATQESPDKSQSTQIPLKIPPQEFSTELKSAAVVSCITEHSTVDYECNKAVEKHVRKQEHLVKN